MAERASGANDPTGAGEFGADVPSPAAPRALRAYPVFVSLLIVCVGGLAGTILLTVVIAVIMALGGMDGEAIQERLTNNTFLTFLLSSPFHLAMVAVALGHAKLTRRKVADQLGLRPPGLPAREWALILLGSGVPLALSVLAAWPMPSIGGAENIEEFWGSMSVGAAIAWVAYIGIVPGVAEEFFCRGLMQRRLLQRWRPLAAIATTSCVFAVLHIDPPAMALALVLGVWLGFVAWRTGSVWPSIAIHAAINSSWNLAQIVLRQTEAPVSAVVAGASVLGIVCLVCFVLALRILLRRTPDLAVPR